MGSCVATATNITESSNCIPALAPTLPTHSQFIPPTPSIHLATSSPKTKCSGSELGCSYLLASVKSPGSNKMLKRRPFPWYFMLVLCSWQKQTRWFIPAGIFSLSGWLENKGATGCINYLTTCFKLPLFTISCFSHSWLSELYGSKLKSQEQLLIKPKGPLVFWESHVELKLWK